MRKMTKEEFISKSISLHGDKYDYSKVDYKNNSTKVIIILNGVEYLQRPNKHLDGKCPEKKIKKSSRYSFIEKCLSIHGDKYDYSKVEYNGVFNKVKIICKQHGVFEQIPNSHLNGRGCNHCGRNSTADKQRIKIDYFIEKCKIINNDKYDYSKIQTLKNVYDIVNIVCPKHGDFSQRAYKHMSGQGCPRCRDSVGEKYIIEFLNSNGISYSRNHSFDDCVNVRKLKFDFYIDKLAEDQIIYKKLIQLDLFQTIQSFQEYHPFSPFY